MQHIIKKYPPKHPVLKNYIKFFWELRAENLLLHHKLIPQRNINIRFNLSDTPQYVRIDDHEARLEKVHFSGLQDRYRNAHLIMNGPAHILGICFLPDGFFPFLNIPANEFSNRLLGADEIGFKSALSMLDQLNDAPDTASRLATLEQDLVRLLNADNYGFINFRRIFSALNQTAGEVPISAFCRLNGIDARQLERMFNKYVGMSASSFNTLNRFHQSLNQLLFSNYSKLSDIAYGNGYYDQMHFIREFKRFAGGTPGNFANEKKSILQIAQFK